MKLEWTNPIKGIHRCSILNGKCYYIIRDGGDFSSSTHYKHIYELEITESLRFRGSSYSFHATIEAAKTRAEGHARELERYGTKIGRLALK
jgi:hypothetical protein